MLISERSRKVKMISAFKTMYVLTFSKYITHNAKLSAFGYRQPQSKKLDYYLRVRHRPNGTLTINIFYSEKLHRKRFILSQGLSKNDKIKNTTAFQYLTWLPGKYEICNRSKASENEWRHFRKGGRNKKKHKIESTIWHPKVGL